MKKRYILIAGVNGAGKSTLYQTEEEWMKIPWINSDEIVKDLGDWHDSRVQMQAGRIAVARIKDYFDKNISFGQETTLCGNSILRNIRRAKKSGYYVELHYVSVDTVQIAQGRVCSRIAKGGHGISPDDVERRYHTTFENLRKILSICDLAVMYDNTENLRRFAIYRNGYRVNLAAEIPEWYKRELGG